VTEAKKLTMRYFHLTEKELDVEVKLDDSRWEHDFQKSPVTIADKKSESLIKSIIKKSFPDHGFFGEEEGEENTTSDYQRVIDPIDGTRNFAR